MGARRAAATREAAPAPRPAGGDAASRDAPGRDVPDEIAAFGLDPQLGLVVAYRVPTDADA